MSKKEARIKYSFREVSFERKGGKWLELQVQHKVPSLLRSGELDFAACYFYKQLEY